MRTTMPKPWQCLVAILITFSASVGRACGDEPPWTDLFASGLDAFKTPHDGWTRAAGVTLDPKNPRKLSGLDGTGVWYNGPSGRARNLFTKQKFGDLEVSLEFVMSKGSNSGVKFHGHYEIQIADSFGKKTVTGSDCGGIYPRAEAKPRYHSIDKGVAPKVNACKAPGEWQTLHAVFQAPRFDAQGKKVANARIVRATLNGQVIHLDQELQWPTGDRWRGPEVPEGVFMIQADHGPVAFRNVKVRTPAISGEPSCRQSDGAAPVVIAPIMSTIVPTLSTEACAPERSNRRTTQSRPAVKSPWSPQLSVGDPAPPTFEPAA